MPAIGWVLAYELCSLSIMLFYSLFLQSCYRGGWASSSGRGASAAAAGPLPPSPEMAAPPLGGGLARPWGPSLALFAAILGSLGLIPWWTGLLGIQSFVAKVRWVGRWLVLLRRIPAPTPSEGWDWHGPTPSTLASRRLPALLLRRCIPPTHPPTSSVGAAYDHARGGDNCFLHPMLHLAGRALVVMRRCGGGSGALRQQQAGRVAWQQGGALLNNVCSRNEAAGLLLPCISYYILGSATTLLLLNRHGISNAEELVAAAQGSYPLSKPRRSSNCEGFAGDSRLGRRKSMHQNLRGSCLPCKLGVGRGRQPR